MYLKRITKLCLIVFLAVISTYSVVLQQDSEQNPTLSSDATLDEIITALETAYDQYETLHIKITEHDHISGGIMTDELWLSKAEIAYRWEFTSTSAEGETFERLDINDGDYVYTSSSVDGQPMVNINLTDPSYLGKNLGLLTTIIAPEDPSEQLRNSEASVEIIGVEMVAERESIKVVYVDEWRMVNYWVDTESGILLQHELLTTDGELVSSVMTDFVVFNPVFEDPETLFYVDASAYDHEEVNDRFSSALAPPVEYPGE